MFGKTVSASLPIVMSKEGKWFVASCPALDIGTQGRSEKEVRENLRELIQEFFSDPDTKKPSLHELSSISLTIENLPVKIRSYYARIATAKSR